jgi:hypothetical protein
LPHETEELNKWLLDRWVEKDEWLEKLKQDWEAETPRQEYLTDD